MNDGGRLGGWILLVGLVSVLGYVGNFASSGDQPDDLFFRWSTAVGTTIQYGFVLGVVLLLARGRWELLALNDVKWSYAATRLLLPLLATYLIAGALSPFLDPGEEQGLTPDKFDASRANAFIANVAVVVIVAPVVEELCFRGLGFSLLRRFGAWQAIVAVGVAFALWHGLLEGLPILFVFGAALAWLRERTGSVYPGMLAHGLFNALAVVAALST